MARPGAGRRGGNEWRIVGRQLAALFIDPPKESAIEPEIVDDDEFPARVGGDHVRMRPVVIAD